MPRVSFVRTFFVLTLALGMSALPGFATIRVVGTCLPNLPSYSSIQAAVSSAGAADVVKVCPGTYAEQVEITQSLTLEGIAFGEADQVTMTPYPALGLPAIATNNLFSNAVAPQLWIHNTSGPVNISNITLDATGANVAGTGPWVVAGIFYQNTSGTIDRVTTRNQTGDAGGVGIWVEGGNSNPSVTVKNSSVHDFDLYGIFAESGHAALTTTINANFVQYAPSTVGNGIEILDSSSTVSDNSVVANRGIEVTGNGTGAITGNTLLNNQTGIRSGPGFSITNNRIVNASVAGIDAGTIRPIEGNTVVESPVGIELNCTANSNVQSNRIIEVGTAIDHAPTGIALPNFYSNVATIRSPC
jgi:hypothetical protein